MMKVSTRKDERMAGLTEKVRDCKISLALTCSTDEGL